MESDKPVTTEGESQNAEPSASKAAAAEAPPAEIAAETPPAIAAESEAAAVPVAEEAASEAGPEAAAEAASTEAAPPEAPAAVIEAAPEAATAEPEAAAEAAPEAAAEAASNEAAPSEAAVAETEAAPVVETEAAPEAAVAETEAATEAAAAETDAALEAAVVVAAAAAEAEPEVAADADVDVVRPLPKVPDFVVPKEPDPPEIDSISPAHGPMRGGTQLAITGKKFAEGCVVRIGDADVEATFESEHRITATLPARASFGFADVRVTNPDGGNELRVHGFQYDTPPLPEFVKPDTLGVRGGKARIFGEAFAEGVLVTVGGLPVPVVFEGQDCLEITLPASEAGPAEITVSNPDGQFAVLKGKLRFSEGPVIEEVSPPYGPPMGGTRVSVAGRGFARGCTVTLFGELAPAVTFESDKKISFLTPSHDPGQGSIRVTNLDGLSSLLDVAFEFRTAPPPVVTELTPNRAWVSGGARLLVSGSNFVEGVTATIGGKDAAAKWKNGGLLEVMVPPGADVGPVDLVIANIDGQTSTTPFTYERVPTPPKLITVTPNRGPTHGNVTVVFTGDNFEESTIVRIAEVRTTTKVLSRTEMEVLVPPHPGEGVFAIELASAEGVVVRSEEAFYYNDRPPPRITGVSPPQGPMSGNTRVSLEGDGFSQDCFVRIGRERPKSISIRGPNLIEIVTPPCKISGFVDIEVGTNATGSSTAKNVFRFVPLPPPSIDSVAPARGAVAGGTEISVSGKNFNAETVLLVSGKPVKCKLISPDLIEAKTPPGSDGQMVDVAVRNPDGKEAVVRRAFAYDARYKA